MRYRVVTNGEYYAIQTRFLFWWCWYSSDKCFNEDVFASEDLAEKHAALVWGRSRKRYRKFRTT